jgi:catechol 2,3-dioxygenase-like lactoylglutathione lyase family enzyme
MKRNLPIAGLLVCLTLVVTIDIAVRLGWVPSIEFNGGIDAVAAAESENVMTPDSPPFIDYPEYPLQHGRSRFFHVGLIVEDLQTSIDYYQKHFGFKLIRTQHSEGSSWHLAFLTTGAGEPILELEQYIKESDDPPTGISHIGMFVSDVSEFRESSIAEGAEWEGELLGGKTPTFPHMGFMIDPDGYRVEVMENPKGNCTSCHRGPHLP